MMSRDPSLFPRRQSHSEDGTQGRSSDTDWRMEVEMAIREWQDRQAVREQKRRDEEAKSGWNRLRRFITFLLRKVQNRGDE